MNLLEQIDADLKNALKSGDQTTLSTLRLLKSAIKNFEIESMSEAKDGDILKLIQKEIKQRRDSIESYKNNQRDELANRELAEIQVIEKYLPKQLSDEELTDIVQEAIAETEAKSAADMGKIMSKVMPKIAGRVEGSRVSAKVMEMLSK
ncbi:MAG: hypothetical protein Athens101428_372 [Candidatus Berkelbacteria bacterium Athens1014_28]|uniref:GatB/YqeY domain-containing protein n=1 Tax=Candidatus Berkelbacteria bacterium Athens1014_28 TaxID=2017145 RepID=A0A554LN16_9BACT|nr:MAG: hypothetical protein Athens101428_372 [Candidatus Berkelbacteria bacterium Athens1014_28]